MNDPFATSDLAVPRAAATPTGSVGGLVGGGSAEGLVGGDAEGLAGGGGNVGGAAGAALPEAEPRPPATVEAEGGGCHRTPTATHPALPPDGTALVDRSVDGPPDAAVAEAEPRPPATVEAERGGCHRDLFAAFEALLLATREPLPRARLVEIAATHGYDRDLAAAALAAVVAEYSQEGHGIQVVEVAGGLQFATQPAQAVWLADLNPPRKIRLSQQAMETLALIAYKQPIIRAEIEQVRGVNPMGTLKTLMEHDLIHVAGRRDIPGKPLLYSTTKNFLKVFGLKRLADLPTVAEFADARTTQEELDLDLPAGRGDGEDAAEAAEAVAEEWEHGSAIDPPPSAMATPSPAVGEGWEAEEGGV